MLSRICWVIAAAAASLSFLATAIPSFRSNGISFVAIALTIAAAAFLSVAFANLRIALRMSKDRTVISAALYDSPETQVRNAAKGCTAFTVERKDGSHKLVTVKNGSPAYRRYMEMIQK